MLLAKVNGGIIQMSSNLFLPVGTIFHRLVSVDPQCLSYLPDVWIIPRSDSFKWKHAQVCDTVSWAAEMFPCWGVKLLLVHTASVLVKSIFRSPFRLTDVKPIGASLASEFVDYIAGIAVNGRSYVPFSACSHAFVFCGPPGTASAHHTSSSGLVALLEPELFSPGSLLK